ncbi:MAG: multidrug effflux MFS transporter [Sutterella sp.]|nr:multidrug effflux MFS transporter [Sutterella sp.]
MLFADQRQNRAPTAAEAAALGFTSSLGPLAVNAYMPGFHQMAAEFGTDLIGVEQSLTLNLMAFALTTLVVGALSDTVGRKRTMVCGMLVFAAASIGAMLSETLAALCFWRVLQGMGASVGQVVTQAMVRDRFSGRHAAAMNGLIAMFFAISPALAPVIGGYLITWFSWHAVFVFLCAYALLVAAFIQFGVAETLPPEGRRPFMPRVLASSYVQGFTHSAFMAGVVANGFCFMGGILYSAGAADYVITIMKLGVDDFAWLTLPTTATTLAGSWASSRLLKHMDARPMIYLTAGFAGAVALFVALGEYVFDSGFPWVLACPCLYWFTSSLARPVMMAMNLDYFPKNRGLAASIQQFFVTSSFAVCSAIWVPVVLGSAWKYALVTAFCAFMMLILWFVSMRLRSAALVRAGVREEL